MSQVLDFLDTQSSIKRCYEFHRGCRAARDSKRRCARCLEMPRFEISQKRSHLKIGFQGALSRRSRLTACFFTVHFHRFRQVDRERTDFSKPLNTVPRSTPSRSLHFRPDVSLTGLKIDIGSFRRTLRLQLTTSTLLPFSRNLVSSPRSSIYSVNLAGIFD